MSSPGEGMVTQPFAGRSAAVAGERRAAPGGAAGVAQRACTGEGQGAPGAGKRSPVSSDEGKRATLLPIDVPAEGPGAAG